MIRRPWLSRSPGDALGTSCEDEERISLSAELLDLAQRIGDRELAMEAHHWRVTDSLRFGDLPAVDDEISMARRISEDLEQPYYRWWCGIWRSMRATLEGDFAMGKRRATEAHAMGAQAWPGTARMVLTVQTIVRLWHQGEVVRLASLIDGFVSEYGGTYPECRLGRPWALAGLGRWGDASRELESLAVAQLSRVPVTQTALIAGAVLAETLALLGDAANAALLYERLHPYAGRVVVLGPALACLGPMDRFLGLLAALAHEWDTAEAHFVRSLERSRDLVALPFVARTQLNHAAVLCARGRADERGRAASLLADAFTGAHRLGMVKVAQDVRRAQARLAETMPAQVAVPAMLVETNSLTREGDHWTFVYDGTVCRIRERAGVRYLAMLLERPHQEVAALQLIGGETADTAEPPRNAGGREGVGVRARRPGSPAEHARVRVTRALRGAINRIHAGDARLGNHLARSVRTGTFCCYAPEELVIWNVARG